MKKMLLVYLFFATSQLLGIINYIDVLETPQGKIVNLLGVHHIDCHKAQELDMLIERLKEEECKGQIRILYEASENIRVYYREGSYEANEVLMNLRPAAIKAGLKTIPEDIEIRKLVTPWQTLFSKHQTPYDGDIPLVIEKEVLEIKDDPTVSFDPAAPFSLRGTTAQEIRNAYKRCIGKSYEEVNKALYSDNLHRLTWQDVLDEFAEHEKNIFDLWNSMADGAQKDAFKEERRQQQIKIDEALAELQKYFQPSTRLLDFAIECHNKGNYKAVCHRIWRLGMNIFSAYFDLNLIHKIIISDSQAALKTFIITGQYHSVSAAHFLINSKLGYKYLLGHMQFDEEGLTQTLDDKYFDCLNMSLWHLKYFPFSWAHFMISLRRNFFNRSSLGKLFSFEPQVEVKKENHILTFLKSEFPNVSKKFEEHWPSRLYFCNAVEADDLIVLSTYTQNDLETARTQLNNLLIRKRAADLISEDIYQKMMSLIKKACDVLDAQIQLTLIPVDFKRHDNLEAVVKELKNTFKESLFFLLAD